MKFLDIFLLNVSCFYGQLIFVFSLDKFSQNLIIGIEMKRFFLLFGLILSCAFCFAFPSVSQFVEAGTGYVAAKNVERDFNPFNFTYGIEEKNENFLNFAPNFKALASVQFSDNIFDFTTLGNYFIPRMNTKRLNPRKSASARNLSIIFSVITICILSTTFILKVFFVLR